MEKKFSVINEGLENVINVGKIGRKLYSLYPSAKFSCRKGRFLLDGRPIEKYGISTNSLMKVMKPKFSIGADVEVEEIFSDGTIREMTVEARSCWDGQEKLGVIGADRFVQAIKLFPIHSTDPMIVVERIRKILSCVDRNLSIQGNKYSLGFHIHIGTTNRHIRTILWQYTEEIVGYIDYLLGWLIKYSGVARAPQGERMTYDQPFWGIEYKTLPSAVLYHPRLTYWVLEIAKRAVLKLLQEEKIVCESVETETIKLIGKEGYEEYMSLVENYTPENFLSNWGVEIRGKYIMKGEWEEWAVNTVNRMERPRYTDITLLAVPHGREEGIIYIPEHSQLEGKRIRWAKFQKANPDILKLKGWTYAFSYDLLAYSETEMVEPPYDILEGAMIEILEEVNSNTSLPLFIKKKL